MPKPKQYATNAERQKAYRQRQRIRELAEALEADAEAGADEHVNQVWWQS